MYTYMSTHWNTWLIRDCCSASNIITLLPTLVSMETGFQSWLIPDRCESAQTKKGGGERGSLCVYTWLKEHRELAVIPALRWTRCAAACTHECENGNWKILMKTPTTDILVSVSRQNYFHKHDSFTHNLTWWWVCQSYIYMPVRDILASFYFPTLLIHLNNPASGPDFTSKILQISLENLPSNSISVGGRGRS